MADQPKFETFEENDFFADQRSARQPPAGVISADLDEAGEDESVPARVDLAFLQRGRERFEIYCSVCHGRTGEGDGMIVQRGYPKPPSFFSPRLMRMPPAYFVQVIRRGFRVMPSYRDKVNSRDQKAIAAYVRTLQLSRQFPVRELTPAEREQVGRGTP